ncbi:MAG: cupredoxin domain-containing protein, partial [Acidimicrobiia bacterium]
MKLAPRVVVVSVVAALAALFAMPAASAAKTSTVKIALTDDGCPKTVKTVAGPNTFKVKNEDASAVSEFEILSGDR